MANQDDVFNIEDDSTQFVTEKLRIRREREWATNFFVTGLWTSEVVGGVDFTQWDAETGATPIKDMETWKELVLRLTGKMPNTLVVPLRVHQIAKNNADIVDRYKYTKGGVITAAILASIFEIQRYLIGQALHAPNPEGDADEDTLEYILDSSSALLLYVEPRPSKRRPSGGYTFRWNRPRIRGRDGERLMTTYKKWYIKEIEGTRVEGNIYEDMKLISADCGVFIRNIWSEES